MGRPGAILGASWTALDAVETERVDVLKMYVFLTSLGDFGLLGLSWGVLLELSGVVLEASWSVLR
eukprot:6796171-Pyramimonas_sp.AAC.1